MRRKLIEAYPRKDKNGMRWRSADVTGPAHGATAGESAAPWKCYDVASRGRVWSPPKKGSYADYIDANLIPDYKQITGVHARLDALDEAGLITHPEKGVWPGLKRYADADIGKPMQDIIYTPTGLTNYSKKGTHWLSHTKSRSPCWIGSFAPVPTVAISCSIPSAVAPPRWWLPIVWAGNGPG